jgi:hypothetical protein
MEFIRGVVIIQEGHHWWNNEVPESLIGFALKHAKYIEFSELRIKGNLRHKLTWVLRTDQETRFDAPGWVFHTCPS